MSLRIARIAAGLLLACAALANAAAPPTAAELQAERDAAFKAVQAAQQTGPASIALRDQAHLQLPAGYVWVPTPAAAQLMRSMGNRVDDSFIGAIFPASDAPWFVSVTFVKEGYIKDDEAKDWNADDLLRSLKEGTEAGNEERVRRGIPAIEVTGWAEKPNTTPARTASCGRQCRRKRPGAPMTRA